MRALELLTNRFSEHQAASFGLHILYARDEGDAVAQTQQIE